MEDKKLYKVFYWTVWCALWIPILFAMDAFKVSNITQWFVILVFPFVFASLFTIHIRKHF